MKNKIELTEEEITLVFNALLEFPAGKVIVAIDTIRGALARSKMPQIAQAKKEKQPETKEA